MIGTLGILVQAHRAGLVDVLAPEFERLREAGLRIHPELLNTILRDVGERT